MNVSFIASCICCWSIVCLVDRHVLSAPCSSSHCQRWHNLKINKCEGEVLFYHLKAFKLGIAPRLITFLVISFIDSSEIISCYYWLILQYHYDATEQIYLVILLLKPRCVWNAHIHYYYSYLLTGRAPPWKAGSRYNMHYLYVPQFRWAVTLACTL